MNQKLIQQIGRSQRISILNLLKRSQGRPVAEMAGKLGMSYMGVKQHCLQLHREGYLDTTRAPNPEGRLGRPEMWYFLTPKSHELFPQTSNTITLELLAAAESLYGATASEKLLYKLFQTLTAHYEEKVKGESVAARAKSLAKLRDAEGYMSEAIGSGSKAKIVEYHSPLLDLLKAYPVIERLEEELVSKILKVPVRRTAERNAGQYKATFEVA